MKHLRYKLLGVVLCGAAGVSGCGGGGATAAAETPQSANSNPIAGDRYAAIDPGRDLVAKLAGYDADGDALSYQLLAGAGNGEVELMDAVSGEFSYQPDADFIGQDAFTYAVHDGHALSNVGTVRIVVNTSPQASGTTIITNEFGPASGSVTAVDTENDELTFFVTRQPTKGSVTAFNHTTGEFQYAPDRLADGKDSFEVIAADPGRTSQPAVVDVTIYQWQGQVQFGSAAADAASLGGMARDADGNFYLTGESWGALDGRAGPAGTDAFIAKHDRRGRQVWLRQYSTPQFDGGRTVLVGAGGDVYVVGDDRLLVVKYSSGGELLWVWQSAEPILTGYRAALDDADNLYLSSWYAVADAVNSRLDKLDAEGSHRWTRRFESAQTNPAAPWIGATSGILARGLAVGADAGIYLSGSQLPEADAHCEACMFLAKLDSAGDVVWLREGLEPGLSCDSGQVYPARLALGPHGDLHIAGWRSDLDKATGEILHTDPVLMKYDTDGNLLWADCREDPTLHESYYAEPVIAANGDIFNYGESLVPTIDGEGEYAASHLFVTRHSATGRSEWTRRIEVTTAEGLPAAVAGGGIVRDEQGFLYLSGSTDGQVGSTPNAGGSDVFLLRLTPEGEPR